MTEEEESGGTTEEEVMCRRFMISSVPDRREEIERDLLE